MSENILHNIEKIFILIYSILLGFGALSPNNPSVNAVPGLISSGELVS